MKTTNYANIRVWQVKVYKNRSFVLIFLAVLSTEILVKTTNHANIRVWQVKVYKNWSFVLSFASIQFLTAFSTVILTEG